MQFLEAIAVLLAIAYLLLAARENIWCWLCAFISSVLFTVIFWDVRLLMESGLNVYYVLMAVLGWWQWRYGGKGQNELKIVSLKPWHHVALFSLAIGGAMINGQIMRLYTDAVWPFVDAFTTWGSVITTVLVVRKVLENWLYWIVIDGISIYLYIDRELYMTAALFAAYVIIVIFGYVHWRKLYAEQQLATETVSGGG